jgi:uncharacterized protein involved in cysteine biosynthesis
MQEPRLSGNYLLPAVSANLCHPCHRGDIGRDLVPEAGRGYVCHAQMTMLDAAISALSQMFTPPFRAVLMKSVGMALLLIVLIGIGLNRLLVWLAGAGEGWAESLLGGGAQVPLSILAWMFSIAATLGIVVGAVLLMPAVTALVASFFVDEIALEVERSHYPGEPAGRALPVLRAATEGVKTALLAVLVYLLATPFLLVAGLGLVIFFFATAFLLSREYFELAAMRYRAPAEAKLFRKAHQSTVFMAGLLIAAFVSIPIVNLATPLFGMALMVHVHKRLSQLRP